MSVEAWKPDDWTGGTNLKGGCVIAIPSLKKGLAEATWPVSVCMSLLAQQPPINFNFIFYSIQDKEVGDARNDAVKFAQRHKAQYLFFRDDDVVAPPDSINKLFASDADIIGGVYYSKQWPSQPLIFRFPQLGGFKDWRYGDIVECDAIGMGCTLIKMSVFDKFPEPWFSTICNPGSVAGGPFMPDSKRLDKQFDDPSHNEGRMTEDIAFCFRAKKAGFKVYAHTGAQCTHIDMVGGLRYGYEPGHGDVLLYRSDGSAFRYMPAGSPHYLPAVPATTPEVVKLNLGAGGEKLEGYIGVDIAEGTDEKGDCSDLTWLVTKYGRADEIRASHLLEHLPWPQVGGVLRNWVWALKPGGLLNIITPDLNWILENYLKVPEDDPEKYGFWLATIFGIETNSGEYHKGGFTADLMRKMLAAYDLEGVKVEAVKREESNQGEIFATARKKPAPAGLPAAAVADCG